MPSTFLAEGGDIFTETTPSPLLRASKRHVLSLPSVCLQDYLLALYCPVLPDDTLGKQNLQGTGLQTATTLESVSPDQQTVPGVLVADVVENYRTETSARSEVHRKYIGKVAC